MNVSENIRLFRQRKNWTQEEVAEKLNMSPNGYGCIERGTTDVTLRRLEQLAEIFEVSLAELLNFDGKFIFSQMGDNQCSNNHFNLNSQLSAEQSECKFQLEKQHLIVEKLQQEVIYLKEIVTLLKQENLCMKNAQMTP